MTNEEMERAIDFLLKSGARADARIEQTAEQLAQLSLKVDRLSEKVDLLAEKVDRLSEKFDRMSDDFAQLSARQDLFADTQANIMRVMTQTFEKQAEINNSLRKSIRESNNALREEIRRSNDELRESMREANNALREEIREVAAAGAATDRRLDRFIEALERGRDAGR